MKASAGFSDFSKIALISALLSGCLAPPPCAEPQAANAAATTGAGASTDATTTAATPAADPGDLSKPVVIWNGDDVSPTAKEWASCDTQPCTATLAPAPKAGVGDSIGLEFKAKGKGYVGFGWNWTSWYAAGATNVTGRKNLKLKLKIVPASAEVAPQADGLRIGLRCAKSDKCGKEISGIAKYAQNVTNGQWHELTIPLADMAVEKGNIWDEASVWEVGIHNWAPTPREFTAYIDDITFE